MSKLFENKYYQQLFGEESTQHQKQQQQKQQQRRKQSGGEENMMMPHTGGRRVAGDDDSSSSSQGSQRTEGTRERLERIFGGAGKKGMKKGQHLMAKPKVTGVRKSDAAILAEGKVEDAGRDGEDRQQFRFKNGAIAVRDDNGRFIIRQGASAAYMTGLQARPRKVKALVGNAQAGKAFAAYWNRKMREAKSFDRKMGYKGKDSRASAVKRSRTYHQKYSHADASRHLDESSPKGYLYLRKERVYRNKDGSISKGSNGNPRVRRAGPALYDFIGVAPRSVNPRKGSVPAGRIQAALTGKRASLSASADARKAMRESSRNKGASAIDAIQMREKWVSSKRAALMSARTQLRAAPHVGSVSKSKGVKRGPMSAEKKAAALAKRRSTLASKPKKEKKSKKASPSSSVSSGPRKPRKDKGAKRAPRTQESLEKQRATNLAKKQASARKGMAAMRSRGSVESA